MDGERLGAALREMHESTWATEAERSDLAELASTIPDIGPVLMRNDGSLIADITFPSVKAGKRFFELIRDHARTPETRAWANEGARVFAVLIQ
jgi:hypothetical protein